MHQALSTLSLTISNCYYSLLPQFLFVEPKGTGSFGPIEPKGNQRGRVRLVPSNQRGRVRLVPSGEAEHELPDHGVLPSHRRAEELHEGGRAAARDAADPLGPHRRCGARAGSEARRALHAASPHPRGRDIPVLREALRARPLGPAPRARRPSTLQHGTLRVGISFTRGRTLLPASSSDSASCTQTWRSTFARTRTRPSRPVSRLAGSSLCQSAYFSGGEPLIEAHPLFDERMVLLATRELLGGARARRQGASSARSSRGDVSPLAECPFVLSPPGGRVFRRAGPRDALERAGFRPRVKAFSRNIATLLSLALRMLLASASARSTCSTTRGRPSRGETFISYDFGTRRLLRHQLRAAGRRLPLAGRGRVRPHRHGSRGERRGDSPGVGPSLQVASRSAAPARGHLGRRAGAHDAATRRAAARPHVDDVVGVG